MRHIRKLMVERMKSWSMYFLGCISLLVNAGVELKPYIKRLMSGFYNSILTRIAGLSNATD